MKILRLGRFEIPREVILDDPEMAIATLLGMIVLRAEMMLHTDAVEYLAISPMFDEVAPGEVPPNYDIIVEKGTDADLEFKARRKSQ